MRRGTLIAFGAQQLLCPCSAITNKNWSFATKNNVDAGFDLDKMRQVPPG